VLFGLNVYTVVYEFQMERWHPAGILIATNMVAFQKELRRGL
jgi:hypothetical protein